MNNGNKKRNIIGSRISKPTPLMEPRPGNAQKIIRKQKEIPPIAPKKTFVAKAFAPENTQGKAKIGGSSTEIQRMRKEIDKLNADYEALQKVGVFPKINRQINNSRNERNNYL